MEYHSVNKIRDSHGIEITRPESAPPTINSNVTLKNRPENFTPVSTPMTWPCVDSPRLPTEKSGVVHRVKDFDYQKNMEDTQFRYDTVNATDSDISLDKLRSEGWRRWNMDMEIEYQYETFNGLPVYYGGDRYDSDDSKEFYPDTSGSMEDGIRNQSRSGGGDNTCLIEVDVTPKCKMASERLQSEVLYHRAEEGSDTSRTRMSTSRTCNSAGHTEELRLNRGDVACTSDFDDKDFADTDVASSADSVMKIDCNTWKSEIPQSYPDTDMCTQAGKIVIDKNHAGNENNPDEDSGCANAPAVHWASGYMDCASYVVPECMLEGPSRRSRDARVPNDAMNEKLEHSITAVWCVNTEDTSYITVCCDCLDGG